MKRYDALSDQNLIEDIAKGNEDAFQVLFDRRVHDVYKLCYSLLLDAQYAEDAAQDSFIKLWKHAPNWKPQASVKTWLLTIARNHCLDLLRKRSSDLKKNLDLYQDHLVQQQSSKFDIHETNLDKDQYKKTIEYAISLLPERQREAITLVYINEVRNSEAASIMGLQAAAFDSLLARARRSLRNALKDTKNELKGAFYGTE